MISRMRWLYIHPLRRCAHGALPPRRSNLAAAPSSPIGRQVVAANRPSSSRPETEEPSTRTSAKRSKLKDDGLTLSHFLARSARGGPLDRPPARAREGAPPAPTAAGPGGEFDGPTVADAATPFLREGGGGGVPTLKFHIKTYGCQMNVNDTDIVRSILLDREGDRGSGVGRVRFVETPSEAEADVLLTNTCAVRENAEQKVWNRLRELRSLDRNRPLSPPGRPRRKRLVGVLGCMAERLKEEIFREGTADLAVGPDAYRDLPRLISALSPGGAGRGAPAERAANVRLSLDETYASIAPVRADPEDVSAFVSIMRGCNNMCSYCVVPFTRGRERSRDLTSIVEETKRLVEEEGIKEVILLGQNVNSYHDLGDRKRKRQKPQQHVDSEEDGNTATTYQTSNPGFSNMFRLRDGEGHRFVDLLEAVSSLSPELRVRFTSPHPKDYPPPLLTLMAERSNICSHLHMPAQSGSSSVLQRMRRGYTREAYLELIEDVRTLIPDVAISSDFIAGFCGETEEEHRETLSLMEQVKFDQAFMFAYSMRGKTHAHRTMQDDVTPEIKNRRLNEVISVFRREVQQRNDQMEVGKLRLVLVEGEAKRSTPEEKMWSGRTDQNKRCVFPDTEGFWTEEEIRQLLSHGTNPTLVESANDILRTPVGLSRGDYAVVRVTEARGHTLKGEALWRSSIVGFDELTNKDYGHALDFTQLCASVLKNKFC